MHYLRRLVGLAVALALTTTAALAQTSPTTAPPGAKSFTEETQPLGNGSIHTWVTLDSRDVPLALGATLTEDALASLPDALPGTETVLPFPPEARAAGLPFSQLVVIWNPQGHAPQQAYGAPHFDFDFDTITPTAPPALPQAAEDQTAAPAPPPAAVPPGYTAVPGAKAPPATLWVDAEAPELHGMPLTQTLAYGYDGRKLAFLESSVALDYLRAKPDLTTALKTPSLYPATGYYPARYSLRFDPDVKAYTIALEGFVLRPAGGTPVSCTGDCPPLCPVP